jgi:hypothetical protein
MLNVENSSLPMEISYSYLSALLVCVNGVAPFVAASLPLRTSLSLSLSLSLANASFFFLFFIFYLNFKNLGGFR